MRVPEPTIDDVQPAEDTRPEQPDGVRQSTGGSRRERPIIAIDGPAGAGKSTLAAYLARRFGLLNLETGAMYRALALKAIENDFGFDEERPLLALAENTEITLEPQSEGSHVLLDGINVTQRIREKDVTSGASQISVHPELRAWMVAAQRKLGEAGGVVMEGRDIGTAVFPDAELKIFLDAAPQVRGSRRYRQSSVSGSRIAEEPKVTEEALLKEMRDRDERDRKRAESPLRPAEDAVLIDSTKLSLEELLAAADRIVRLHLPKVAVAREV